MYRTSLLKDNDMWFVPKARKGQDVIFNAECLQLTDKYFYIHKALYHYRYLQESVTNRFNEKAQYYNEVAFENYERIINKFLLSEEYWNAYYARVVTRLLDDTLDKYPYCDALKKVDGSCLTKSQKVFVYFLKKRNYGMLKFLVDGRIWLKNIKGARLK